MHIWEYVTAVFTQGWALLSCAAFTILAIGAGVRKKSNQWLTKASIALALVCLFIVAPYLAWLDQYRKAKSQTVYMETHLEPNLGTISDPTHRADFLSIGSTLTAKFACVRTGQDIAERVVGYGRVFVEPDSSMKTQHRVVADFIPYLHEWLADRMAKKMEGPTLGYHVGGIWITPTDPPTLTKPLLSELWYGTKIVFYISAVVYEAPSGQKYESHFCQFMNPLHLSFPSYEGKPMPENVELIVTHDNCDTFNDTVTTN